MKYVYVIGSDRAEFVKIGVAADVALRIFQLQAGHPYLLRELFSIRHPYAYRLEALAHERLSKFRLHGEWFGVPVKKAANTLKAAADDVPTDGQGCELLQTLIDEKRTARWLQSATGLHFTLISKYINGHRSVPIRHRVIIEKALGKSISWDFQESLL
jgi:hypothetical protein